MAVVEKYVATNGVDSPGNGTIGSPWLTIAYALTQAAEGTIIYLRAGTYAGGFTISTKKITLQAYPGEIANVSVATNNASIEHCIRVNIDADDVTLRNLDISGGYYYAVKGESNWGWQPAEDYMPYHGSKRLLIEGCKIHDSGQDVVKLAPGTDYARITGCEIYNSGLRVSSNAEGVDAVNVAYLLFDDNHIHDIATTGIYVKGGSVGAIIERNRVEDVGHSGIILGQDTSVEWFDPTANPDYFESIDCIARFNTVLNTQSSGITSQASLRSIICKNTLTDVALTLQAGLVVMGVEHFFPPDYVDPVDRPDHDARIFDNEVTTTTSGRDVFAIRTFGGGAKGTSVKWPSVT